MPALLRRVDERRTEPAGLFCRRWTMVRDDVAMFIPPSLTTTTTTTTTTTARGSFFSRQGHVMFQRQVRSSLLPATHDDYMATHAGFVRRSRFFHVFFGTFVFQHFPIAHFF
jgi:hypothetical protein